MSRVLRYSSGVIVAALLTAAPALGASAPTVKASSGPLTAVLAPPPHDPTINRKVPITVTATVSGKPAKKATAYYVFLLAGVAVTAPQYVNGNKNFTFNGHYSDTLDFPAQSLGEPLTFRVVVKDAGHTVNLDWAVKPVR
jgi:hypothetical protein